MDIAENNFTIANHKLKKEEEFKKIKTEIFKIVNNFK